jgi:hypothetical protein
MVLIRLLDTCVHLIQASGLEFLMCDFCEIGRSGLVCVVLHAEEANCLLGVGPELASGGSSGTGARCFPTKAPARARFP